MQRFDETHSIIASNLIIVLLGGPVIKKRHYCITAKSLTKPLDGLRESPLTKLKVRTLPKSLKSQLNPRLSKIFIFLVSKNQALVTQSKPYNYFWFHALT